MRAVYYRYDFPSPRSHGVLRVVKNGKNYGDKRPSDLETAIIFHSRSRPFRGRTHVSPSGMYLFFRSISGVFDWGGGNLPQSKDFLKF